MRPCTLFVVARLRADPVPRLKASRNRDARLPFPRRCQRGESGHVQAAHDGPLRDDIDRGRTGDRVDVHDPAAAPLGTDEEAAGTPAPADAVRQARDYERAMGRKVHGSKEDTWGLS